MVTWMNHLLPLFGILLASVDAAYVFHFHPESDKYLVPSIKLNSINVFGLLAVLFCIRNKIDTTKPITHLPVGSCSRMSLL